MIAVAVDQSFPSIYEQAENVIIKNGEFNDGLNDWVVSNPEGNNPSLVTDASGNNYVQATYGESIMQYVQLKPSTHYKFTYYVYGGSSAFPAIVEFGTLNHDEGFKPLAEEQHYEEAWKQHEFTFTTPEEENTYIIRFASTGNGTAYFDNIQATSLDLEAPSAPLQLKVDGVTTSSVSLSWGPATDNVGVTSYLIYRDGEQIDEVSGETLAYTNTGLTENTAYTYTIYAVDKAGNRSAPSNSITTSTAAEDNEAPSAPLQLKVDGVTTSSVSLSWGPATDNVGVTSYLIYRDGQQIDEVTGETLAYTNTDLTEDTAYTYKVYAKDKAGNVSEPSNEVTATTSVAEDNEAPSAPLQLKVDGVTTSSVSLSWEPATDNIGVTSYLIYRDGQQIDEVTGEILAYTNTDLAEDTAYTYKVYAKDKAGNVSEPSNEVTVTTSVAEDNEAPSAPLQLKVDGVTTSSVSLSWEAATDNVGVTSYLIYRDGQQIDEVTGETLAYINTGLTEDTAYTYKVYAKDKAGNVSEPSNEVTTKTSMTEGNELPLPPAALRAESIMEDKVVLMWEAPASAMNMKKSMNMSISAYQIYRNGLLVGEVSGETLNYTDTGLTENTQYKYTVKTKDTLGNLSEASNSIVVLTSKKVNPSSPEQQVTPGSSTNMTNNVTVNEQQKNKPTKVVAKISTDKMLTEKLPQTGSQVYPIIQALGGILVAGVAMWFFRQRKKN
ncbi:MAG: fibronectin type III domain-containing protein [Enterococcus lacertideformus]|uniref:Fibronectin type III domain-containing protein n=1 Tax=Enterococcus lacertideformus TaxID=2771493 RepID=A0A931F9Y7_9ENTE|nr:fibronectin type III domain-containing protein [Enterococcus lacertideformus]